VDEKTLTIETIEKDIYNPCKGLKLKHVVTLGSKDKNNGRKEEYYIYQYKSEKYINKNKLCRLKCSSSEYLVLEPSRNQDLDISFYMSYKHIFAFKKFLKACIKWFEDYDDIIIETKDDIIFNSKYDNLMEISDPFLNEMKLKAIPDLVEDDEYYSEGIILYLSQSVYFTMTLMELESLYDFLSTFNLYQSTLTLIEYYNSLMNRPDVEFTAKNSSGIAQRHHMIRSIPQTKKKGEPKKDE